MRLTDALRILGGERGERLASQLRLRAGRLPAAVGISATERSELDRAGLLAQAVTRRVRLRDVLRAWERGHRVTAAPVAALADLLLPQIGEPPYTAAWYGAPCQPYVHSVNSASVRAVRAALDRLISRYGADSLVADVLARLEAERTDHVVGSDEVSDGPHTDPAADAHGGDGNSGECDAPAETAAADREGDQNSPADQAGGEPGSMSGSEGAASGGTGCGDPAACDAGGPMDTPDRQSGENRGPDAAREGDAGSERADSAAREGAEQPTGEGDTGADEVTEGMGSQQPDREHAGDETAEDARGRASAAGDDHDPAASAAGATTDGDEASPGGPVLDAALGRIDQLARRALRDGARVADLLRRIVEAQCAPRGRESPRVDARALVRELVSRRVALHRTRRKEAEIRDLIIAVDESGSCAHTVDATYAAALAAARALPRERVSVLLHTNGRMIRAGEICAPWVRRILKEHARDLRRHYYSRLQAEASDAVWHEISRARPGMVLAMGDHDAWEQLDIVHRAGVPVLMLAHAPYEADYPVLGPVIDASSARTALEHFSRGGAHASK
ncbi:MAG: hypothetical protein N2688_09510 [Burkholderiaceae bacterium]|nr:hypothetical protein [Burkholderiaceae bacterium]